MTPQPHDGPAPGDFDTTSRAGFFNYYESASQSPATLERFRQSTNTLLRLIGPRSEPLQVLDIGCGAGAQSKFWLEGGHHYRGLDINQPLIELARRRAEELKLNATFDVGTATELPLPDQSVDVCLLPELLEHVADWRRCVEEAARVLRPGGWMFINTSSKLCPVQQEFSLPLYSWYPHPLKRYFERRAVTDWPALASHATYPAVNWFTIYGLSSELQSMGFECYDRFDLIDTEGRGSAARAVVTSVRRSGLLRFFGHLCTPYTLVVARKEGTA